MEEPEALYVSMIAFLSVDRISQRSQPGDLGDLFFISSNSITLLLISAALQSCDRLVKSDKFPFWRLFMLMRSVCITVTVALTLLTLNTGE